VAESSESLNKRIAKLVLPIEALPSQMQKMISVFAQDLQSSQDEQFQSLRKVTKEALLEPLSEMEDANEFDDALRQGIGARSSTEMGLGDAGLMSMSALMQRGRTSNMEKSGEVHRLLKRLNIVSMVVILLNTVFIGIETNLSMDVARSGRELPDWLWWVNVVFTIAFTCELLARLAIEQMIFFFSWWNAFETVLVILAILNVVAISLNLRIVMVFRIIRCVRAVRIMKVMMMYARPLRILLTSLRAYLSCMLWTGMMMFFNLFIFAVVFMELVQNHIVKESDLDAEALNGYRSVEQTVLTLFMAISGGLPWHTLVLPLVALNKLYMIPFVCFVTLTVFGMLNLWSAMFVHIMQSATTLVDKPPSELRSMLDSVTQSFADMDIQGEGRVALDRLPQLLKADFWKHELEVDRKDLLELLSCLDIEQTGSVSANDFVYAILRLKQTGLQGLDLISMLSQKLQDKTKRDMMEEVMAKAVEASSQKRGSARESARKTRMTKLEQVFEEPEEDDPTEDI